MEQHKSTLDAQSGDPPTAAMPPAWMRRTAPHSPDRRAQMLDHMARAGSVSPSEGAKAVEPPRMSGRHILRDAYGHAVLSAIIALLLHSRVPLYLGAFIFLTDVERIESALATIGIRFEPEAIGPEIVKGFVSLFGWFALLVLLRNSVPGWLAAWMPPAEPSWSVIAVIALAFVTVDALATRAMRRTLPWPGLEIRWDSLTWNVIKLVLAIGGLALLALHSPG